MAFHTSCLSVLLLPLAKQMIAKIHSSIYFYRFKAYLSWIKIKKKDKNVGVETTNYTNIDLNFVCPETFI